MAFAASNVFNFRTLDDKTVEVWKCTQANTDTGGTFTSDMEIIDAVFATGNTASPDAVGSSFSSKTVTVVTTNGAGTQAPTIVYVLLIGQGR